MNQTDLKLDQFTWTDVISPSKEILESLAIKYSLSKKLFLNCLDPDYLPHIETYGATQFVILRFPEPDSKLNADTVQELTTKVALFINSNHLTSIHRVQLSQIDAVDKKARTLPKDQTTSFHILTLFFEQVALSFDQPLTELEQKMEIFEEKIFHSKKTKTLLQEGYYIKRKASAYKKVIKFTLDIMAKLVIKGDCPLGLMQETKDRLDRCLFYADDIFENVQGLLNLHMSIESQRTNEASFRTNEIVRVLTVLSIFFLPLNFLAGLYGMNFEHIPLLKDYNGFWYAVGFMTLICGGLLTYVGRKGWLTPPPKE
jgi:magnesium transporter